MHRIAGVEKEIGAGLIEEVIQVAEGELKLVDEMAKSQVYATVFTSGPHFHAPMLILMHRWDELAEKPRPGQWSYFERTTGSS